MAIGTNNKPGDSRLMRWKRVLQVLQNKSGALASNNPHRGDSLRRTLVRILDALLKVGSNNLIPIGSAYNAQSQFSVALVPGQTYHFTLGANDSILDQGLQEWLAPQNNTAFTAQTYLGTCNAVFTGSAANIQITAILTTP